MSNRRIVATISLIAVIGVLLILVPQPVRSAEFVLAQSEQFPDEYGQGIRAIMVYGNSTGSWEFHYIARWDDDANPPYVFEWNATLGIKIIVLGYINYTLVGFSTEDEGKLYQRHNVTVVDRQDALLFTQQNFTFVSSGNTLYNEVWYYEYEVVLNFLPLYGEYYTITIEYEVFW